MRSDRGGEYLNLEFSDHLKQCGIIPQLTLLQMPQWNGMSKRRNRTLLDMVRSMMRQIDLLLSFWGYALETAMSHPVLRKRERSLHTCAQDVQITCTITI
jgi:hypothetical protein